MPAGLASYEMQDIRAAQRVPGRCRGFTCLAWLSGKLLCPTSPPPGVFCGALSTWQAACALPFLATGAARGAGGSRRDPRLLLLTSASVLLSVRAERVRRKAWRKEKRDWVVDAGARPAAATSRRGDGQTLADRVLRARGGAGSRAEATKGVEPLPGWAMVAGTEATVSHSGSWELSAGMRLNREEGSEKLTLAAASEDADGRWLLALWLLPSRGR